jgi:hypothetical protein
MIRDRMKIKNDTQANSAYELWLIQEENRKIRIKDLKIKKEQIQEQIDSLRAVNPYYPISTYAAKICNINKELRRIDGYDKRFL